MSQGRMAADGLASPGAGVVVAPCPTVPKLTATFTAFDLGLLVLCLFAIAGVWIGPQLLLDGDPAAEQVALLGMALVLAPCCKAAFGLYEEERIFSRRRQARVLQAFLVCILLIGTVFAARDGRLPALELWLPLTVLLLLSPHLDAAALGLGVRLSVQFQEIARFAAGGPGQAAGALALIRRGAHERKGATRIRRGFLSGSFQFLKRATDMMAAAVLLSLLVPLLVLVAIAIKIDSRGPVFFRQKRSGLGGADFAALKFRTMHTDAEQRLAELLRGNAAYREQYERFHKLPDDPRVTRVGRLLRRTSLDELPQLWNVLVGDMSLIGYRPYMPRELAPYPELARILGQLRPGITGLWQVSGRHRLSFEQRLLLDAYYVQHCSPLLDLFIVWRTVWVVLRAEGA
ncbi:sugar transferase [Azospirillum soli]|uniref:sugar transferase n=1 Tax=Azospirillum soli TaxID=1304799 RepID=UPI001AE251EB|nr:sugar transferase [Azospirillum soli]MBP2312547.1 lipopolysaccharide/colanic/teichoic acid biosynthesis glycosyltransferase [Azospirillum soli]